MAKSSATATASARQPTTAAAARPPSGQRDRRIRQHPTTAAATTPVARPRTSTAPASIAPQAATCSALSASSSETFGWAARVARPTPQSSAPPARGRAFRHRWVGPPSAGEYLATCRWKRAGLAAAARLFSHRRGTPAAAHAEDVALARRFAGPHPRTGGRRPGGDRHQGSEGDRCLRSFRPRRDSEPLGSAVTRGGCGGRQFPSPLPPRSRKPQRSHRRSCRRS